jgi:hypothetical protein
MAGYSDLLTDIRQGYAVVDLGSDGNEDTVLRCVSQDITQGYNIVDILEEEDDSWRLSVRESSSLGTQWDPL